PAYSLVRRHRRRPWPARGAGHRRAAGNHPGLVASAATAPAAAAAGAAGARGINADGELDVPADDSARRSDRWASGVRRKGRVVRGDGEAELEWVAAGQRPELLAVKLIRLQLRLRHLDGDRGLGVRGGRSVVELG